MALGKIPPSYVFELFTSFAPIIIIIIIILVELPNYVDMSRKTYLYG